MKSPKIILIGGCGTIGLKLHKAWPLAICVDKLPHADLQLDLADLDGNDSNFLELLGTADVVIHLATSADPDAAACIHLESIANTAKLLKACTSAGVPKLVMASSDWARPKARHLKMNAYGYSKQAIEAMASMYALSKNRDAVAIRIGWVPDTAQQLSEAPSWLLKNYWDDQRLITEFKYHIDPPPAQKP
ncbi:NAD(P)-dependent oxidoreductase [Kiritimatiellaeota bacterium B1221]|nr:NAD(P)-dependent oxidoreductase [Kiritimatiellaeota bacterium B1221]